MRQFCRRSRCTRGASTLVKIRGDSSAFTLIETCMRCSSDSDSTQSPARSPSKREAAVAAERAAAAEQLALEMGHLRGQLRATR